MSRIWLVIFQIFVIVHSNSDNFPFKCDFLWNTKVYITFQAIFWQVLSIFMQSLRHFFLRMSVIYQNKWHHHNKSSMNQNIRSSFLVFCLSGNSTSRNFSFLTKNGGYNKIWITTLFEPCKKNLIYYKENPEVTFTLSNSCIVDVYNTICVSSSFFQPPVVEAEMPEGSELLADDEVILNIHLFHPKKVSWI